jgi:hypothetical protein
LIQLTEDGIKEHAGRILKEVVYKMILDEEKEIAQRVSRRLA